MIRDRKKLGQLSELGGVQGFLWTFTIQNFFWETFH